MNIDKAIEILQSGLITQQEQSELATVLQTAVLAEREACLVILETYPTVLEMIKAIRERGEK